MGSDVMVVSRISGWTRVHICSNDDLWIPLYPE